MAAVGSNNEIGLGPRTVKRPRALHGTDNVVSALYDNPGDMADARGAAQQLVVRLKKTLVEEIVDFNASEGERESSSS